MIRRLPAMLLTAAVLFVAGCATQPPQTGGVSEQRLHRAALINTQLGIDYMRSGDLKRAYDKLKLALSQYPDSSTVNYAYALLMQRLGEDAKARAHYQKALQLDPKNSDAHNNYGVFLCQKGEYAKAQTQFKAALANPLYGTPQVAYANSGFCYLDQGNKQAAEHAFKAALNASPDFKPALYGLVKLYSEAGRWKTADRYLQQAGKRIYDWPPLLGLCLQVKQHIGDLQGATQCARMLYRRYPNSPEAKALLDGGS